MGGKLFFYIVGSRRRFGGLDDHADRRFFFIQKQIQKLKGAHNMTQAILGNAAHPECGVATILFPIPRMEGSHSSPALSLPAALCGLAAGERWRAIILRRQVSKISGLPFLRDLVVHYYFLSCKPSLNALPTLSVTL